MSELLEKISCRGYWKVVVRPGSFVEKRIEKITDLEPLLQRTSVQLRGWGFPHFDSREQAHIYSDWIQQESEWEEFLEVWRFYQTGQFVDFAGIPYDWDDQSQRHLPSQGWKPGEILNVQDALFTFTEIFEFAARLALSEAGDEFMRIEVTASNLAGRALRLHSQHYLPLPGRYKATINELPYQVDLSRTELISEAKELALKPAVELFRRFGWEPEPDMLRNMQERLRPASAQT